MNRSAELPLGMVQAQDRAERQLGAPSRFMVPMHVQN